MSFPFRIDESGAKTSSRTDHVREQIEQVLFTNPGERVFRPEFGVGVRRLIFEPNNTALWEITKKRLSASLVDALRGEVDPRTLEVEVTGKEETTGAVEAKLFIVIRYELAAIGHREQHVIPVQAKGNGNG
jgi:phage baseplate assembly protein W